MVSLIRLVILVYEYPVRVVVSMASLMQVKVMIQLASVRGILKKCFQTSESTNLLINLAVTEKMSVIPPEFSPHVSELILPPR